MVILLQIQSVVTVVKVKSISCIPPSDREVGEGGGYVTPVMGFVFRRFQVDLCDQR